MKKMLGIGFSVVAFTLGCSTGAPSNGGPGGPDSDAGTGGALDATTADAPATDMPDGAPAGDGGGEGDGSPAPGDAGARDSDTSCIGQIYPVNARALDLYVMLDQSGSMSESVDGGATKWTSVTGAINAFLTEPSAAGLGVGLQYFGLNTLDGGTCTAGATCSGNADCGTGLCVVGTCSCTSGDSCLSADYQRPDVEIAPLPAVAPAISASIAKHSPSTATPTSAALQGAVDHAHEWAVAHADHTAVVVLATDGDPSECDTSLTNIAAIAQNGVTGTPKVLTFVIGIGASLANLNAIAAAGGTTSAFIVDTGANVNQQFVDALNKIRGAAQGCAYGIPVPNGGAVDYARVNVEYAPGGTGIPLTLARVADAASCPVSGDAWYYDVNVAPTQILLCGSTCAAVRKDAKTTVAVVLGCSTNVH